MPTLDDTIAELEALRREEQYADIPDQSLFMATVIHALRVLALEVHIGHHQGIGSGHPAKDDHPAHNF